MYCVKKKKNGLVTSSPATAAVVKATRTEVSGTETLNVTALDARLWCFLGRTAKSKTFVGPQNITIVNRKPR